LDKLVENGVTTLEDLKELEDEDEIEAFAEDIGLSKVLKKRFIKAMIELNASSDDEEEDDSDTADNSTNQMLKEQQDMSEKIKYYEREFNEMEDRENMLSTKLRKKGAECKKMKQKIKNYESKFHEKEKCEIALQEKCKQLQAENEKQKEQIVTMEAVQISFDKQLKQKHAECKELKQKWAVFETMQSLKTKHYSEWDADAFLHWITNLNEGKFKEYEKKFKTTFAEQSLDGKAIQYLQESHWKEFGVVNFVHRIELHKHVQDLKKNSKNPKNMVQEDNFDDQKEGNNDDALETAYL